jgi:hypothetical protein
MGDAVADDDVDLLRPGPAAAAAGGGDLGAQLLVAV